MKKLALSLAVLFAVGLVSCGGNKENKEACDSVPATEEMVVAEDVVADSTPSTDSVAAEAVAAEAVTADSAK